MLDALALMLAVDRTKQIANSARPVRPPFPPKGREKR
jgi:hypothetical protein